MFGFKNLCILFTVLKTSFTNVNPSRTDLIQEPIVSNPSDTSPNFHPAATLASNDFCSSQIFNCIGGSVYVVAHPDDDLIFQSPDLLHDIRGGACTTTVYLTSGDAGDDPLYPKSREAGIGAAYAQMAGVADAYTSTTGVFGGQPVHITTLVSQPSVQQVWFRLPDGNGGGTGYSRTGYQTLLKLYLGDISAIVNTQRTAAFSLDTLESALFEILSARRADAIRILDYMSSEGDHTDHLITARIVHSVVDSSALPGRLIGYLGNLARHLPSTLPTTDSEFVDKLSAFLTYAKFDKEVCQSEAQCSDPNDEKQYFYWEGLQRQYYI